MMPEFHIGDAVVTRRGDHFVVKGICQGPLGLLYQGDGIGWTPEDDLDYDISEAQREVLRPLEHALHTIRVTVTDLAKQVDAVRAAFYGVLPAPIRRELAVLGRLLAVPDGQVYPGKIERTDLLELIACARTLRSEALRYANEQGRFPDRGLKDAMTCVEDATQRVEEML